MALPLSGSQLFGGVMVLVGVVVLAFSARYVWRATSIYRAIDVASLDGAAAGMLVRVAGTAQRGPGDALLAPFSGEHCFALRYAVEERRLSPLLLPWFVTVYERARSTPFRVHTPEGRIDVVAPARTVTLERQTVATVTPDERPPERIERFDQQTSALPSTTIWRTPPSVLEPIRRFLSLGTRRYTEEKAMPDGEVTVVGNVTEDGDSIDPLVVSDRSPATTVLRMAKTSLVGLAIGGFGLLLGLALLVI
ncbi:hypothetical protein J2752_002829 [Halarchaeum rubridurum]|uniref:Uncharacterized protein n=1 Tax=Halarchaeum rubridurum TaxID=489911 RepID=A0A830G4Y9_9EURY|nr:hypothetical protein [Halarchaeum rubridurum]MBP1955898.1 hypothetical protein [Halarchaeum rubridurum]GGM75241.1 hypothetical protein GCM10009017_26450 [Halarchaeum rubridurum]